MLIVSRPSTGSRTGTQHDVTPSVCHRKQDRDSTQQEAGAHFSTGASVYRVEHHAKSQAESLCRHVRHVHASGFTLELNQNQIPAGRQSLTEPRPNFPLDPPGFSTTSTSRYHTHLHRTTQGVYYCTHLSAVSFVTRTRRTASVLVTPQMLKCLFFQRSPRRHLLSLNKCHMI